MADHIRQQIALHLSDCADDVRQADKIIALAKAGERNPDALCEQVLKHIRGSDIEATAPPSKPPMNGTDSRNLGG